MVPGGFSHFRILASYLISDRTFTRPARLYIENELIRLVEIKE